MTRRVQEPEQCNFATAPQPWLLLQSFISQLQWIKQQDIPCRRGSRL